MTPLVFAVLAVGCAVMRNGSKAPLDSVVYMLGFVAFLVLASVASLLE